MAASVNLGQQSVLIVEDDGALRKVIGLLAQSHGFSPIFAPTCASGIGAAQSQRPNAAIVDLGLPDQDGMHFVTQTRTWSNMPILVLSARTDEAQRLAAFEAGADDFVLKPFNSPELFARMKALLRRTAPRNASEPGVVAAGGISMDVGKRIARRWDGEAVKLTPLEHRILEILAQHPDRVVMHERILQQVWGPNQADMRSLRVYVKSLRRKLERDPARPVHIVTESGVGYRLALDAAPS